MIKKDINKIFYLLTKEERKKSIVVLGLILVMAILDMIGVASILPFIAVISNPEIIETNILLNKLYIFLSRFGVETQQDFFFSIGVIVFILLVSSLAFKAFSTYVQVKFSVFCGRMVYKSAKFDAKFVSISKQINTRSTSSAKRPSSAKLRKPVTWPSRRK